jgi:predicted nuclease of predicted toxin-antitoxin system
MKLLFDQNISFRLVKQIAHVFPSSKHVSDAGLLNCEDQEIWLFAKNNGFVIVTFDSDYFDIALINGCPPKVIWLRTGNLTTKEIASLLLKNSQSIDLFVNNPDSADLACFEIE